MKTKCRFMLVMDLDLFQRLLSNTREHQRSRFIREAIEEKLDRLQQEKEKERTSEVGPSAMAGIYSRH